MYEKTLTIGTAKVNNAYEWKKVSYGKNQAAPAAAVTSASVAKAKQKQQKHKIPLTINSKNLTETQIKQSNLSPNKTTTKPITYFKPATQTPQIKKYVGNAARRQTLAHQIKRAHRHLLTSGGNDRQPSKQQRNKKQKCTFSIEWKACSALFRQIFFAFYTKLYQVHKANVVVLFHISFAMCTCLVILFLSYRYWYMQISWFARYFYWKYRYRYIVISTIPYKAGSSAAAAGQQTKTTKQQQQQQRNKRIINANKQSHSHKSEQQKHKQKKQSISKRGNIDGYKSELSSRWGSIEEQLNVLDKLLHYDEQAELYLAQLYNNYQQLQQSESELSDDWSWSDSDMDMSLGNSADDDALSSTSGAGSHSTNNSHSNASPLVPSSLKRRGHQHHPRFAGTRRPNVPNVQEILAALYRGDSKGVLSNLRGETNSQTQPPSGDQSIASRSTLSLPLTESVTNSLGSNSPTPTDESSILDETIPAATSATTAEQDPSTTSGKKKKKRDKGDREKSERKKKSSSSVGGKRERIKRQSGGAGIMDVSSDSIATDLSAGAIDEGIVLNTEDEDTQAQEWAKLRCTSEAAEIVAEREARRNKGRCADYPGLAFGRSIFSSDTMMKFNIIRNELHNIMNTQLKRVISCGLA